VGVARLPCAKRRDVQQSVSTTYPDGVTGFGLLTALLGRVDRHVDPAPRCDHASTVHGRCMCQYCTAILQLYIRHIGCLHGC
jgi:hypothetical protein